MTGAYFDTSAIIKRYLEEHGAVQVRRLIRRFDISSSVLAPLQATSALVRRHAAGDLGQEAFDKAVAGVKGDSKHWELVQVEERILEEAEAIILKSGLKTVDALHVASALCLQQRSSEHVPFITADRRQAAAARAHGLDVIAL